MRILLVVADAEDKAAEEKCVDKAEVELTKMVTASCKLSQKD
jgi:hypothetical protein